MEYYNQRRRHGSIKYMAPQQYYEAFMNNSIKPQASVANIPVTYPEQTPNMM
jgi:hypothetical protein